MSILVPFAVDPYAPAPAPPVAMFIVTVPEVPPPDKLVPAVTPVMSPTLLVKGRSCTCANFTLLDPSENIMFSSRAIAVPAASAAVRTILSSPA